MLNSNTLTSKEKLKLLTKWLACYKQIEKTYDDARKMLGLAPESPIATAMYDTFQAYTEVVAAQVGDSVESLNWFIWDNEAGKKGLAAGVTGKVKMRPIRTVKDLLRIIEG